MFCKKKRVAWSVGKEGGGVEFMFPQEHCRSIDELSTIICNNQLDGRLILQPGRTLRDICINTIVIVIIILFEIISKYVSCHITKM